MNPIEVIPDDPPLVHPSVASFARSTVDLYIDDFDYFEANDYVEADHVGLWLLHSQIWLIRGSVHTEFAAVFGVDPARYYWRK